jgi:hypothetical protein
MFQLVYSSMTWPLFTKEDVADILSISRNKNRQHDITGVLLYKSGSVIQLLEGAEPAVRQLYTNIQRDPRHRDFTLIYTRTIAAREFPDWTMGFNCVEVNWEPQGDGFNPVFHRPDHLKPTGRGAAVLKTFIDTTR